MTHPRTRSRRALPATLIFCLAVATPSLAALPRVPEGFEIRLVAAVPAVEFPCQVATAPDGSLFVAEDPMDQVGPANKPIDRILVFREGKDKDREPVVFADKLNAVFGMVWHDGSLYVMNMPNLTVLRDTDGDGKADQRKELFTDLGVPAGMPNMFNDHIVSGLQIGIDGFLYISVGDKGVPLAHGPDGRTAQVFGGGVLRCRLDGTGLEVFSNGTRNHLEPNLDARDNLFTYDNTDDGLGWWTRVTHHVDGGYYGYPWDYHDRTDRMLKPMADYGGGSPCGGLVYKEDAWPEKYRGRAFWTEWAKRTVRAFAFEPKGSTFKVADVEDFIQPGDVSDFRPLDLALSYDGKTMYVADWGMGGWGNKTEKLGRVYAVTYQGEIKTLPRGKDSDPVDAQIKALGHPSYNERRRAQTALLKKDKNDVLKAAVRAFVDPGTGPVARRHLVWVVDGVAGGVAPASALLGMKGLTDKDSDVRSQSARALGLRGDKTAVKALMALASADPDPSVRLNAVNALGRIGEPVSIPAILPLVGSDDDYLAFAARKALKRIDDWNETAKGLDSPNAKVRAGVLLAMEMVYKPGAASALAKFAADPSRAPSERARALFLLAQGHRKPIPWDGKWWGTQPARTAPPVKSIDWEGTQDVLAALRGRLSDPVAAVRLAAVSSVAVTNDPSALPIVRAKFAAEADGSVRREMAKVFGTSKDRASLPLLIAAIRDKATPEPVRDEALSSVEAIGSDEALKGLLALLEDNTLGADRQPRVIAALGRFKTADAGKALLSALKSPSAAVRASAAEAVGKASTAKVAGVPLRALTSDPSVDVRKAAISAIGLLKDRASVPTLVEASNNAETRFEATLALAAMPDARALPAYLRGLTDKSPDLRKASSSAIAGVRDDALPMLEKLAARKELSPAALPELRKVFTRLRPVQTWELLGPFPIKTEPPFPVSKRVDLKATYSGFSDTPIAWKHARAVDGRGQINLASVYNGNDDQAAFGYAEFQSAAERRATFAVGSDDTLTVWVNGEKVYDFQDRRGFTPEESSFDAMMVKGTNRVLVKCGNRGGPWQFSLAVAYASDYAFLQGPAAGAFDPEAFRAFAQSHKGKPDHGKALFNDLKGLACVKCHAVGGQGGAVGPELTSVGVKYPKDEIITSVLYPSAKISSGYEPVVIALADGRVVTGVVKGETAEALVVDDVDARHQTIPKSEIDARKLGDVSLMPSGLAEGLSREDFADLVAYLETLKDKDVNPVKPGGAGGR